MLFGRMMVYYGIGIGGLIFRWIIGVLLLIALILFIVWLAKKVRD